MTKPRCYFGTLLHFKDKKIYEEYNLILLFKKKIFNPISLHLLNLLLFDVKIKLLIMKKVKNIIKIDREEMLNTSE